MVLMSIKKSTKKGKKMMASFENCQTGRLKTIHFGALGYDDYTRHRDSNRKMRYIERHKSRENWNIPDTAGSLSRWILWNKISLKSSIEDYKRRFKLTSNTCKK
jgi:hypothetical protein